jgi:serine/threonine protein kinase
MYKTIKFKETYVDKSIDIWSFGITLYKMAVAYFPTAFNRYQYGSGPIPFRKTDWKDFEGRELIQDLITKCLVMEPSARITVEEALDHPWFKI